ncbi:HEAT repeat domain-containing protein [Methylosinus sp. RM1]|uniref:HEAT repeat domain-containing protein n=1 Tax=Methylosinus sp. RM1 TaxID=2583817 RepID=UPI00140A3137|nr:HEAT repeat domain-containing protein [Methylosinus sp. RM1]
MPVELDEKVRPSRELGELIQLIQKGAIAQRLDAAHSLVAFGEVAAEALCAALLNEADDALRDAIAVSLARVGGRSVVSGLAPMLRSDDAAIRNIAVDILKELPQAVAPLMETRLDDPDPDVRILLVNVLGSLRHAKVEQWLIDVVDRDENVNLVAVAIEALDEIGGAAARGALSRAADRFSHEPFIVFSAENALLHISSRA